MRTPRFLTGAGLLALLVASGAACGGDAPPLPPTLIKTLTWNLYLGADLVPLATVATPADIPTVAAAMWAKVQATDFPARAKIIAAHIAELNPDLVGLQEVTLYRRQSPSDFQPGDEPNAITVELDFLHFVLVELAALNAPYDVVVEAPNADVELPVSDAAGGLFDLRVTDRDVILARNGLPVSGGVQQKFEAKVNFPVGGAGGVPLSFTRSVSHVEIQGLGRPFTFANSHLEIEGIPAVQMAQANEMLAFLGAVPGPMLLVGDFNSAPGLSSYPTITKAFKDLAATKPSPATDFTCCQSEDLTNPTSTAGERIDLVLTRGPFTLKVLSPLGTDPAVDRTPSGRWASDHFGVFAALDLAQ